jgi:hypothetical protein
VSAMSAPVVSDYRPERKAFCYSPAGFFSRAT